MSDFLARIRDSESWTELAIAISLYLTATPERAWCDAAYEALQARAPHDPARCVALTMRSLSPDSSICDFMKSFGQLLSDRANDDRERCSGKSAV
jgi:hypothetical protein